MLLTSFWYFCHCSHFLYSWQDNLLPVTGMNLTLNKSWLVKNFLFYFKRIHEGRPVSQGISYLFTILPKLMDSPLEFFRYFMILKHFIRCICSLSKLFGDSFLRTSSSSYSEFLLNFLIDIWGRGKEAVCTWKFLSATRFSEVVIADSSFNGVSIGDKFSTLTSFLHRNRNNIMEVLPIIVKISNMTW